MAKWLWIIGVDADGRTSLTHHALSVIRKAHVILTSPRLAQLLASDIEKTPHVRHWSRHIDDDIHHIRRYKDTIVVILASGDPLYYGVATRVLRIIPIEQVTIMPARSSISLACAKLGWTQQHVTPLSLHGRNPHHIRRYLSPKQRIIILSEGITTLHAVAQALCDYGMRTTTIIVLSQLGSPQESHIHVTAQEAHTLTSLDPLTILAIECGPCAHQTDNAHAPLVSTLTTLPDTAWRHDGLLTKQAIRASAVSALSPHPAQTLWDIGSGSGSIAIEWMRLHHQNHAVAIEQNPQRCAHIRHNARALGTPTLTLLQGHAPHILSQIKPPHTKPDAIFIGGGLNEPTLIDTCYRMLQQGQHLVSHSVTIDHAHVLFEAYQRYGGNLQKIQTHSIQGIGSYHRWHAMLPVTQWSLCKA